MNEVPIRYSNPAAPVTAEAMRQRRLVRFEVHLRKLAHMERCSALPPMQPGEAERLMAAFIAARGLTLCPPAYVASVQ